MNTQIENKIKASNQKYLSGLIGKVLPDRLEKQLEELGLAINLPEETTEEE